MEYFSFFSSIGRRIPFSIDTSAAILSISLKLKKKNKTNSSINENVRVT